ncbi:energy transducer TonB, partial [Pelomonas sp. KK5]|uniref:energy transducer TonB n=1 Tax=Pelomonas sp. KK5 TaxID=1855730 RepID=UPI00117F8471
PSFVVPEPTPAPPTPLVSPPMPPAPPAVQAAPAAPAPKKVAPSSVRYLKEPTLNFPLLAKRAHESGLVVLRIVVDAGGRLKEATVHKSSGFERIDQQALQDIRSARFVPQMEEGKPIEWETLARLDYIL